MWPFSKRHDREYLHQGRLEDVLALIQVLGLDTFTNRGESALSGTLGEPRSSKSWITLAKCHPEFFRVTKGGSAALIARHFTESSSEEGEKLTPDHINGLIRAAIALHNGQLQRKQTLRIAWGAGLGVAFPVIVNLVVTILSWRK